jgi:hypothetical protein
MRSLVARYAVGAAANFLEGGTRFLEHGETTAQQSKASEATCREGKLQGGVEILYHVPPDDRQGETLSKSMKGSRGEGSLGIKPPEWMRQEAVLMHGVAHSYNPKIQA